MSSKISSDVSQSKSASAFRTIGEVAAELDVPRHVLRFWESKFSQIRPMKRGGGRRYYRPEDVHLIRTIRELLYDQGYTIKGAQRFLREAARKPTESNAVAAVDSAVDAAVDSAVDSVAVSSVVAAVDSPSASSASSPVSSPVSSNVAHSENPTSGEADGGQDSIESSALSVPPRPTPPHLKRSVSDADRVPRKELRAILDELSEIRDLLDDGTS